MVVQSQNAPAQSLARCDPPSSSGLVSTENASILVYIRQHTVDAEPLTNSSSLTMVAATMSCAAGHVMASIVKEKALYL
ncbi:hypothetical protein ACH5RR_018156 [Cinchona calisaya]|uniref:Uncharacterized protein n=1 Tax=Cinchona calisaya TaxID=153742 RepID=A0ABD2ZPC5_9GENT